MHIWLLDPEDKDTRLLRTGESAHQKTRRHISKHLPHWYLRALSSSAKHFESAVDYTSKPTVEVKNTGFKIASLIRLKRSQRVTYVNRELTLETSWRVYMTSVLTLRNSRLCAHVVILCFVWISDRTAIISLRKHQLTGFYDPGGMFTARYEMDLSIEIRIISVFIGFTHCLAFHTLICYLLTSTIRLILSSYPSPGLPSDNFP